MAVPSLRFKCFNKDYANIPVGKIGKFYGGGTPDTNVKKFWNGSISWISSSDILENDIKSIKVNKFITSEAIQASATRKLPINSLLIISRVGVGKFAIADREICTSQDFTNIIVDDALFSANYIAYNLYKNRTKLLLISQGTSIKGFTTVDLKKLLLTIPTLPEQQKIADFLNTVDVKINLLKKKKALLEQYKKGVMQKIFSQELRFKDEQGNDFPEWKNLQLDKIISQFIVPMRDKPTDLHGQIPWCRIEDFNGRYLGESKSKQGVSEDTIIKMNLKVFPVDTLLVSCSADLGRCAIVKKPLTTNQTFIGLVPKKDKVDVNFLYYEMIKNARKLNTLSSGTTISYLSREKFEKFVINLPSLVEQQKIADFLTALDDKIDLVEQQINKTDTWKKGLLQQMLV